MKSELNKYYCSKHGNIGNPYCQECIENLRKLCMDKNVYLTGDIKNKNGGKKNGCTRNN